MDILTANQIQKQYGAVRVLKSVSCTIHAGEVVSIVGSSGAGKTTLLSILGTLELPDAGSVQMEGVNLCSLNSKKLAAFRNANMGFVFQFYQLLPEFTALENVMMPALIGGKSKSQSKNRAEELLSELGLGERLLHKPSMLSGGEQQRVAVARALINKPKLIFADEPSGNLDSATAHKLHDLFFDLRNKYGYTFVIVTHNTELAARADRTIKLIDGAIA
jgi:lipoprotein-releasing system ATP-binding protein